MGKRILSVLLLVVIVFSSLFFWWQKSTQVVNPEDKKTKIFVIGKGENIRQVVQRLQEEDLIRSKLAFFLLVKKERAEKNIQAGTFRLSASMSPREILKELSHGTLDTWLTIIEGWRNEEIASLLEKELTVSSQDFLKVAQIGLMFPDTYAFPKEASAGAVVKIMLTNFDRKFDQKLKAAVKKEGLTESEAITLASIVEREAKYDADRPIVAGVLFNRLRRKMPLQADATIQYALGYQAESETWWKKNLTKDDLKIDSSYNSYLNVGLPPTPICNPGLAAIQAVAQPAKTDHLYYLSDKEGKMHYAKTLEEHNENIRKYLPN